MTGIVAINKPVGMTSHDVVNILRRKTGIKRIGHAGTLDPLASGVLVVAIGREYTKQLNKIVEKEKEYEARIKFGYTSSTDDEEGEKSKFKSIKKPGKEEIEKALLDFIGTIRQMPPLFSSVKIKGKPAYRRARRGEKIKLGKRTVDIKKIEILKYRWPYLNIRVVCGPGVYIRSLARDLGDALEVGGYLSSLVRTRVGNYKINEAHSLEDFEL